MGGESVILGSSSSSKPIIPIVVKNNSLYWRVEELKAESHLAAKGEAVVPLRLRRPETLRCFLDRDVRKAESSFGMGSKPGCPEVYSLSLNSFAIKYSLNDRFVRVKCQTRY